MIKSKLKKKTFSEISEFEGIIVAFYELLENHRKTIDPFLQ